MSIASEISRLQTAKADLKTAIEGKGVTVSSSAKLDDYPDYVSAISTGITPTGNVNITQAGVTDVTNYATATVASGSVNNIDWTKTKPAGANVLRITHNMSKTAGYITAGNISSYSDLTLETATVTPTTSSQTITPTSSSYYLDSVTVNAVASGTAGTPVATKSAVNNHAVTVTPSVTNTTGYITGSTITGTGVNVSASELVSGTLSVSASGTTNVTNYENISVPAISLPNNSTPNQPQTTKIATITPAISTSYLNIPTGYNDTARHYEIEAVDVAAKTITDNGTYYAYMDGHTGYSSVTVNVSGSSGTVTLGTKTTTLSSSGQVLEFTGLSGNPTSFVVTPSSNISTGSNTIAGVVYDGTTCIGQTITTQVTHDDTTLTSYYSNGTLSITSATPIFQADDYKLVYTYDGSSSDIHTANVQVGSGATSITFTGLSGNPLYWSCIFKSDFSTSSGYQRVIEVVNDGTNTYGYAFDSSAKAQTSWTSSYSGGSLTITSSGTNNGGYFHQPGYYQLTYAVDASAPQYETVSKTYRASTSAQSETIQPSSGYDAIEAVSISIPAVSQTNLTAANIKSGTTISISNGQSNLWSVTGTYTGGGGGSFSVATTTWNNSTNTTTSHEFTGLSGTPKFAVLRCTSQLTRSSSNTYYYIADIVWNGTDAYGNYHLRSNGSFNNVASNATTKFTVTTGTNSITFTSGGTRGGAPGSFYNGTYELTYIY